MQNEALLFTLQIETEVV